MFHRLLLCLILIVYTQSEASSITENDFQRFSNLVTGKINKDNLEQYNLIVAKYTQNFEHNFILPITLFAQSHLPIHTKSLFYPFSGPDISYPLLFFPHLDHYLLVGMEFPGHPEIVTEKFNVDEFQPQVEGFLRSGFFKTMDMSAQMYYHQGIIPMLITQISLLGGKIQNIQTIDTPFNGLLLEFTHNNIAKKLHYFRANLSDHNNKTKFFEFLKQDNLLDNCMLKASSYKLHQPEFKQLQQFMLHNCKLILQDDTGIPVKLLEQQNRELQFFGNYTSPYGDEFKNYSQQKLANLYILNQNKIPLNFCYGYGCNKVEANILVSKMK